MQFLCILVNKNRHNVHLVHISDYRVHMGQGRRDQYLRVQQGVKFCKIPRGLLCIRGDSYKLDCETLLYNLHLLHKILNWINKFLECAFMLFSSHFGNLVFGGFWRQSLRKYNIIICLFFILSCPSCPSCLANGKHCTENHATKVTKNQKRSYQNM